MGKARTLIHIQGTNQSKFLVKVQSPQSYEAGDYKVSSDFVYDSSGRSKGANMVLSMKGEVAAKGRIERTRATLFSLDETLNTGEDTGTQVEFIVYDVPDKFNVKLNKQTVPLD